jgi:thioredoxin reductase
MPSHDDDAARHYDVVVVGAGPAGAAAAELGGNLGYSVAKCHPLEDEESLARRRQYQQAKGTNEEGKYHG